MNASSYRVLFCDLRTDQPLDVLPVDGLSFDDYIGKTGSLSGTVPIPNDGIARRAKSALLAGHTAVWVFRGHDIWWGGILWTDTPESDERGFISVPIQAGTFDSYLERRRLYASQTYTQVDQLAIPRSLVDYAQGLTGGNIGLTYDTTNSGVLRDRTYSHYDLPNIRELIEQLSQVDGGFEWRVQAYRDPVTGNRVKRMRFGYPKIQVGATDIVLSKPGPIVKYSLPRDASGTANVWQSRGESTNQSAENSTPLMSSLLVDTASLDQGWPRLDGSSDYSTVSDLATLNTHAVADHARALLPVVIPSVTVRLDGSVTPAMIGSTVRIRIRDLWHPDGSDVRYRITGWRVQPPERGQAETADLFLEAI